MRIFVSHSHEQRDLAADLTARLRADGHRVFQDASSLSKGDAYDRRIRQEIEASDLFLFLLAPASIRPGCYALTELGIAQRRWPNPARHVLPVWAAEVPGGAVPSYLRAVSILKPTGELAAEVVNEVAAMASRRHRRWYAGAATAGLLASGLTAAHFFQSHAETLDGQPADAGRLLALADTDVDADADPGADVDAGGGAVDQRHADAALGETVRRHRSRRHAPDGAVAHDPAACKDDVLEKNGSFWLVCRCKDARTVPESLPIRSLSLDDARAVAARVEWHCP